MRTAERCSRDLEPRGVIIAPNPAYLRASTSDQDANRARNQLQAFAAERGLTIRLVCRERKRRNARPSRAV
jgi:hypothetical protein